MTLTFRSAANTEIDSAFISWGFNEAMLGFFDTMFGPRRQEILAAAARIPGHDLSFEHITLAEMDNQMVGMLSGMPSEKLADITPVLRQCAGINFWRFSFFYLLGWPMFRAIARHSPGEWYLQAIAVSPMARNQGVGSSLMSIAEEKAHACGCGRICLDVAETNIGGIRLYERRGYNREWTSSPAWLLGGVRVHRMSKTL